MLDTNVVSAIMREPAGAVAQRVTALATPVSISIVVAAELRYGAARKGSARLTATVEQILAVIEVEALSPPVDVVYGRLRDLLERQGQPMDANDLWIAAHALTLERVLATGDQAFARVGGLRVENWLA
jgi:tRNA(fMet)-specific endonuclease VapC